MNTRVLKILFLFFTIEIHVKGVPLGMPLMPAFFNTRSFVCPGRGFFKDPTSCHTYHNCLFERMTPINTLYCPNGLGFDEKLQKCDKSVKCEVNTLNPINDFKYENPYTATLPTIKNENFMPNSHSQNTVQNMETNFTSSNSRFKSSESIKTLVNNANSNKNNVNELKNSKDEDKNNDHKSFITTTTTEKNNISVTTESYKIEKETSDTLKKEDNEVKSTDVEKIQNFITTEKSTSLNTDNNQYEEKKTTKNTESISNTEKSIISSPSDLAHEIMIKNNDNLSNTTTENIAKQENQHYDKTTEKIKEISSTERINFEPTPVPVIKNEKISATDKSSDLTPDTNKNSEKTESSLSTDENNLAKNQGLEIDKTSEKTASFSETTVKDIETAENESSVKMTERPKEISTTDRNNFEPTSSLTNQNILTAEKSNNDSSFNANFEPTSSLKNENILAAEKSTDSSFIANLEPTSSLNNENILMAEKSTESSSITATDQYNENINIKNNEDSSSSDKTTAPNSKDLENIKTDKNEDNISKTTVENIAFSLQSIEKSVQSSSSEKNNLESSPAPDANAQKISITENSAQLSLDTENKNDSNFGKTTDKNFITNSQALNNDETTKISEDISKTTVQNAEKAENQYFGKTTEKPEKFSTTDRNSYISTPEEKIEKTQVDSSTTDNLLNLNSQTELSKDKVEATKNLESTKNIDENGKESQVADSTNSNIISTAEEIESSTICSEETEESLSNEDNKESTGTDNPEFEPEDLSSKLIDNNSDDNYKKTEDSTNNPEAKDGKLEGRGVDKKQNKNSGDGDEDEEDEDIFEREVGTEKLGKYYEKIIKDYPDFNDMSQMKRLNVDEQKFYKKNKRSGKTKDKDSDTREKRSLSEELRAKFENKSPQVVSISKTQSSYGSFTKDSNFKKFKTEEKISKISGADNLSSGPDFKKYHESKTNADRSSSETFVYQNEGNGETLKHKDKNVKTKAETQSEIENGKLAYLEKVGTETEFNSKEEKKSDFGENATEFSAGSESESKSAQGNEKAEAGSSSYLHKNIKNGTLLSERQTKAWANAELIKNK